MCSVQMTRFIDSDFYAKRKKWRRRIKGRMGKKHFAKQSVLIEPSKCWKVPQKMHLELWNTGAKDMLSGCHRRDSRVLSQADWSGSQWLILERDRARMLKVAAFNFKKFQHDSSRSQLAYNYWHSIGLLWAEMAFLVCSLQRLKIVFCHD